MNLTFIRYKERYILLVMDFIAFNLAYYFLFLFRFRSGLFENPISNVWIITPALATSLYWIVIFALNGRYKPLYGQSRLDSLWYVFKTTGFGILIIYVILTFSGEEPLSSGKITYFIYWALLFVFAGGARFLLRTVQHHLIIRGIALSPTLIIGFNERGKKLLDQVQRFRTMGFQAIGFIDDNGEDGEYKGVKRLGKITDLERIIPEQGILEVLIALGKHDEELTERVIGICGQFKVNMKMMPEVQQLIYGQVRTMGVHGMPLIEVFPDLMEPWAMHLKRLMDIIISLMVLTFNLPTIIITAIVIKLESKGPAIYSQKRVGRYGREFTIYKFRSMVQDAEKYTGVKWAEKNDPRLTRIGAFLRKSKIDEIPQFFNVLLGNMSLVGPRPERKYFVDQFIKEIPLYSRRHNVKPGITGYGQLRGVYDASLEDVKTRLSLDMQYINNMSISLDIKIMFQTVFLILKGKAQH